MHHRRRCEQGTAFGARIRHVKAGATLRHCSVDRENAGFESRQNLIVYPGTQDGTLCRVLSCDQQRSQLNLQN